MEQNNSKAELERLAKAAIILSARILGGISYGEVYYTAISSLELQDLAKQINTIVNNWGINDHAE